MYRVTLLPCAELTTNELLLHPVKRSWQGFVGKGFGFQGSSELSPHVPADLQNLRGGGGSVATQRLPVIVPAWKTLPTNAQRPSCQFVQFLYYTRRESTFVAVVSGDSPSKAT